MKTRQRNTLIALLLWCALFFMLQAAIEHALPQQRAQDGRIEITRQAALDGLHVLTGWSVIPGEDGVTRCTLDLSIDDTRELALYLPLRAGSRLMINGEPAQRFASVDAHLAPLTSLSADSPIRIELLLENGSMPTGDQTSVCLSSIQTAYGHMTSLSLIRVFSLGISSTICLYSLSLYRKKTSRYLLAMAIYSAFSTLWVAAMVFPNSFLVALRRPLYNFFFQPASILRRDALNTIWRMYLNFIFRYLVIREFVPVHIGRRSYLVYGSAGAAALAALLLVCPQRLCMPLRALSLPLFLLLELFVMSRGDAQSTRDVIAPLLFWPVILALWLWEYGVRLGIIPTNLIDTYVSIGGNREMLCMFGFLFASNRRYALRFAQADALAHSLETVNASLETQVAQKTQELKDAYIRQQKQQDAFISTIAHNLKTPLFSLIGYTDMARACLRNEPEHADQLLAGVKKNAEYMQRHVQDLLLVTRLADKRIQFRMLPFDLAAAARQTLEVMISPALERSILIRNSIPASLTVCADRFYLQQALENLLDNAIAHSGGDTISLSIAEEADCIRLSVTDNGSGIAPEDAKRIFERYYSRPGDGKRASGLGLSICREIMQAHNGDVELSTSPQGSRFTLVLPKGLAPDTDV